MSIKFGNADQSGLIQSQVLSGSKSLLLSLPSAGVAPSELTVDQRARLHSYGDAIDQVNRSKLYGIDDVGTQVGGLDTVKGSDALRTSDGKKLLGVSGVFGIELSKDLEKDVPLLKEVASQELAERAFQSVNGYFSPGDFGEQVVRRLYGQYGSLSAEDKQFLRAENDVLRLADGRIGEAALPDSDKKFKFGTSHSSSFWKAAIENVLGATIAIGTNGGNAIAYEKDLRILPEDLYAAYLEFKGVVGWRSQDGTISPSVRETYPEVELRTVNIAGHKVKNVYTIPSPFSKEDVAIVSVTTGQVVGFAKKDAQEQWGASSGESGRSLKGGNDDWDTLEDIIGVQAGSSSGAGASTSSGATFLSEPQLRDMISSAGLLIRRGQTEGGTQTQPQIYEILLSYIARHPEHDGNLSEPAARRIYEHLRATRGILAISNEGLLRVAFRGTVIGDLDNARTDIMTLLNRGVGLRDTGHARDLGRELATLTNFGGVEFVGGHSLGSLYADYFRAGYGAQNLDNPNVTPLRVISFDGLLMNPAQQQDAWGGSGVSPEQYLGQRINISLGQNSLTRVQASVGRHSRSNELELTSRRRPTNLLHGLTAGLMRAAATVGRFELRFDYEQLRATHGLPVLLEALQKVPDWVFGGFRIR